MSEKKKKVLAFYDVMGIQDFVFSSNKLKENIGASSIVTDVFETYLVNTIKDIVKDEKKYLVNWHNAEDFQIMNNDNILAEVVYIGGGNALVAYQCEERFREVNRALCKKILESVGGEIKFAVGKINTDFSNFAEDRKKLINDLRKKKRSTIQTGPLPGIAITREGQTDGLPAWKEEDDIYLSYPAFNKRKAADKNRFEEELLEKNSRYKFPKELDQLGMKKGENHLAVVHIDGNNMGIEISRLLEKITDYKAAVQGMRQFARQTSDKFKTAMKNLTKKMIVALQDERKIKTLQNKKFRDMFNLQSDQKNGTKITCLPLRPLVLSGDDVTFVTVGKIGLLMAEAFLELITDEEVKVQVGKQTVVIPLSACAGTAIVKTHFPFYRAYQLAEELCSSAKQKGKILAKQKHSNDAIGSWEVGSWLDFHIVYSGITTNLSQLRKSIYNIPMWKQPDPLKYPEYEDEPEMDQDQYNLLWRPWLVAGPGDDKDIHHWSQLKNCWKAFKINWQRSNLKKLRNESIKSRLAVIALQKELESRNKILPVFQDSSEYLRETERKTPYFDALELLDFYTPFPGE